MRYNCKKIIHILFFRNKQKGINKKTADNMLRKKYALKE
ncbi:Uncharacterised protein [Escherichia coli]|uniref:Uncharacterized protein n=1 Tax=Escherichia coli TaxID=562 RepID=A0A376W654_ECOLX|nr:Uncharacterised protein [Escherichia coli]